MCGWIYGDHWIQIAGLELPSTSTNCPLQQLIEHLTAENSKKDGIASGGASGAAEEATHPVQAKRKAGKVTSTVARTRRRAAGRLGAAVGAGHSTGGKRCCWNAVHVDPIYRRTDDLESPFGSRS